MIASHLKKIDTVLVCHRGALIWRPPHESSSQYYGFKDTIKKALLKVFPIDIPILEFDNAHELIIADIQRLKTQRNTLLIIETPAICDYSYDIPYIINFIQRDVIIGVFQVIVLYDPEHSSMYRGMEYPDGRGWHVLHRLRNDSSQIELLDQLGDTCIPVISTPSSNSQQAERNIFTALQVLTR